METQIEIQETLNLHVSIITNFPAQNKDAYGVVHYMCNTDYSKCRISITAYVTAKDEDIFKHTRVQFYSPTLELEYVDAESLQIFVDKAKTYIKRHKLLSIDEPLTIIFL